MAQKLPLDKIKSAARTTFETGLVVAGRATKMAVAGATKVADAASEYAAQRRSARATATPPPPPAPAPAMRAEPEPAPEPPPASPAEDTPTPAHVAKVVAKKAPAKKTAPAKKSAKKPRSQPPRRLLPRRSPRSRCPGTSFRRAGRRAHPPPRETPTRDSAGVSSRLPDPALVVLVGASGSGKSAWAEARYRREEVVSSDALRGVVGSGPHDLDASTDAFTLLDRSSRPGWAAGSPRSSTRSVSTSEAAAWLTTARDAGLPGVAVVVVDPGSGVPAGATPSGTDRYRRRSSPAQLKRMRRSSTSSLSRAGTSSTRRPDRRHLAVEPEPRASGSSHRGRRGHASGATSQGLEIVLQVSRFPWGEEPAGWLRDVALAADGAGFSGIALMDHLIQIPQVGRAWEPIPEPWVTLGLLAALDTRLRLGTLVTPVTFRPAGIIAKAAATLDALSGGRAFVGIGAGWWEREHAAFGLPFPPAARTARLSRVVHRDHAGAVGRRDQGVRRRAGQPPRDDVLPAAGRRRPGHRRRRGRARTMRIAARLGRRDQRRCDPGTLDRKIECCVGTA